MAHPLVVVIAWRHSSGNAAARGGEQMPFGGPGKDSRRREEQRLNGIAGIILLIICLALAFWCAWTIATFQLPLAP